MQKKKALITGITGQSGSYLAEILLEKDYEVFGMLRRNSVAENQYSRLEHITNNINTEYGDLTDIASIERILKICNPDEIYNTAAQSHVRISFDIPIYTIQANVLGLTNMLEAYRTICPKAKLIQSSSSEMFGNSVDNDGFQRETTPMHPVSPYGVSKLFGYSLVRNYRKSYKLFASNYLGFNHESPRRGTNFVTAKVVKTAIEIKKGLAEKLVLGNIDSYRDWGHARDYMIGAWTIIQHTEPDDFVLATGETHSIRDLCKYTFDKLGMDYKDYVIQDPKFLRPEELKYLKGDSTKARTILGWKPTYTFETLLDEMIEYWQNKL